MTSLIRLGPDGCDDHHDAHGEDPDQQLDLHRGLPDRQQDEADQRDSGDARTSRSRRRTARPNRRRCRPVQSAITPGLRASSSLMLKTIFIRSLPMSAILVKMPPAMRSAEAPQRLADGEADEAGSGVVRRHEEQDAEHHQELDADQHRADGHARLERNGVGEEGLAPERRRRRPGVGEGVHARIRTRPRRSCLRNPEQAEDQMAIRGKPFLHLRHSAQGGHVHRHDADQHRAPDDALHPALRAVRTTPDPASSASPSASRWAPPRCASRAASSPRIADIGSDLMRSSFTSRRTTRASGRDRRLHRRQRRRFRSGRPPTASRLRRHRSRADQLHPAGGPGAAVQVQLLVWIFAMRIMMIVASVGPT